ncbi:hypothetical protein ACTXT7_007178 [Hymenolepis weldensis]
MPQFSKLQRTLTPSNLTFLTLSQNQLSVTLSKIKTINIASVQKHQWVIFSNFDLQRLVQKWEMEFTALMVTIPRSYLSSDDLSRDEK